ncbi:MAG: phosphoribosylformylglycinamidine cyclo-ligase [Actinomycetaceae bacterium]|nr:phosphoribosylformylglycinamidine cyclo-ligase [Actinomycetaceae bacterium]
MAEQQGNSYARSGVDVEAGDRAVDLMRESVARTMNSGVIGGVGGFAGMVDVSLLKEYERPLLATSTDGVGTKIAIAQAMDVHNTIGQDLVGMVVDDIVVVGARPVLMTDYIACGHVVPSRIADIVSGVARACESINVPLLGGETAEHPGLMGEDDYDIAGAATGVVEASKVLGPHKVQAGDVLIGMESSGVHSNGFSLVRHIVSHAQWELERYVPEFSSTLGEELLTPTRLYTNVCLRLAELAGVHAFSHITGGGLGANVARVIPQGLAARVNRSSVHVLPVFQVLSSLASLPWEDLEETFNLGTGMVAIVSADIADDVMRICQEEGMRSWICGDIVQEGAIDVKDYSSGTPVRRISGTKGVDGGSVVMLGEYSMA